MPDDILPAGTTTDGVSPNEGLNSSPTGVSFFIWIECGETIQFKLTGEPSGFSDPTSKEEWYFTVSPGAVVGTLAGPGQQIFTQTLYNETNQPDRWQKINVSSNFATFTWVVEITHGYLPNGPDVAVYNGTPIEGTKKVGNCCPEAYFPASAPSSASAMGGSPNLYGANFPGITGGLQPALCNIDAAPINDLEQYGPRPAVEKNSQVRFTARDNDGNWWSVSDAYFTGNARQISQLRLLSYPAAGNGGLFCRPKSILFTQSANLIDQWQVQALEWSPFENCLYMAVRHTLLGPTPADVLEIHKITFNGESTLIWSDPIGGVPASGISNQGIQIVGMIVNGDGSLWWFRWDGAYDAGSVSTLWRKPYGSGIGSAVQVNVTGATVYKPQNYVMGPMPLWPTQWGDVLVGCAVDQLPTYAVRYLVTPDGVATIAWEECDLLISNYSGGPQNRWLKCMRNKDFSKVWAFNPTFNPPRVVLLNWAECAGDKTKKVLPGVRVFQRDDGPRVKGTRNSPTGVDSSVRVLGGNTYQGRRVT